MNTYRKSILFGCLASIAMLSLYFLILTVVSGWNFAAGQFIQNWYFIVSLVLGFGIQIGLYVNLKSMIRAMHGEAKVLGVTGATSTAAMISCCAHYLVGLLPILGTVGIVTFIAQYQIQLFWLGLAFNLAGIIYMAKKVIKFQATYV